MRSLALLLVLPVVAVAADKPNILFIMTDDHAAHAVGAYGGRLAKLDPTPTLDQLAKDGVRLKNCFVTNSICTPSRATLLTGQYSHTNGVRTLSGKLPEDKQLLPKLMKQAGYETAMIGKWHLEAEPAAFDFYTVLPGQGQYFNPVFLTRGPKAWPQNEFKFNKLDAVHVSDAVTDLSLKWLEQRKDKTKPFFLMHHFKDPHDNFENAERYDFLYANDTIPEPDSLWKRGAHGPLDRDQYGTSVGKRNTRRNMGQHMFVPEKLGDEEYKREAYQRYLKKYLRCVKGVDDNVARLLAHLKKTGELDNTIVIYTSDQGFMLGEHDYIDKRWMYEESLRVPFIVRHPKTIPAGKSLDFIANNTDFAPTLLALAGAEVSKEMQGRSFADMLRGKEVPQDWRTATYYRYWMHMAHHDNPAHLGIRTDRYKLIHFYGRPLDAEGALPKATDPHWELYDLTADPHEMTNLIADPKHKGTVEDLKRQLRDLQKSVGDTMPE
jgi:arylsulfatase A-like enzyme